MAKCELGGQKRDGEKATEVFQVSWKGGKEGRD